MKWRWWPVRRRPAQPSEDARAALQQAQRYLLDAERLDDAATDMVARLRATSAANGFGAAAAWSMRPR